MLKKYALGLCDQILHVYIVAQVFLISSIWHFCISFRQSKFKTRIHSKSCTVRNALKKQAVHKYVISIYYYEKKHSFYNSGTIYGGFFNPTP